ncbi:M56 family metallopeptidase [Anaerocolumna sp. MB42-C2]|uniref:M56 family metallopeptidase n=1 Tax=Anaerocolumna sp. MB42-C2 TaxID=3070997 RepID=UPI0027DEE268|nr:M56 family metallopeptidase [Anaerocolumna sp. MB42-C2]WMJ87152.1 M56 family metallopeptidase [Anaerocolumna sp. MB42-C2]
MEAFLIALLQCTLSMSMITLLYAAVLPILSKRYAPKWRYMVWLVIAAGWLIPFRPLIELPFLPAQSLDTPFMPVQSALSSPVINNTEEVLTAAYETTANAPGISIWTVAFFIWLAGMIVLLSYHFLRHKRFMKIVGRWSETVTAPEIMSLIDILKREQGIKAKIEYKTCSGVSSPMLVSFFHPAILMPPVQLSKNELSLILRHELTHFKRHDLWSKALILMVTVMHWFNPVVYFMARAASVQCEISCDALVLQNADSGLRRQYGETIITVMRNSLKTQSPLTTNFYGGKQGMKNRIASILDTKRKKAGVIVLCLVLTGILLTGVTLVSAGRQPTSIPNTSFTEEEYGKLLALRFDGYKDMSVSKFQQKVWTATDTAEYPELLEWFYEDTELEETKDTNDIASFLFYELIPLTSERWKSRYFLDSGMTSYKNAGNAQFDYTCTLSILDADHLTVGEYYKARKAVMDGLLTFFQNRSEKELQNEPGMKKAIDTEIDSLAKKWSSDALTIDVDYFFIPLEVYEDSEFTEPGNDTYAEEREYPHGTEEDYRSLLKLKTSDYQNRALSDFNADVLDWANEDYDRMERIGVDAAWNDFAVSLTPEELSFVTLTYNCSGKENAVMIRSEYTGKPEEAPSFGGSPLIKEASDDNGNLYCSLYYQMSYHISDKSKITVGERDRCVGGVINGIQKFWDGAGINELLSMSKDDMIAKLKDFAKQYSNKLITITFEPTPQWFGFEQMDDRYNDNSQALNDEDLPIE